jgi:pimeloyl-ACP methyl ester carboxylesterase
MKLPSSTRVPLALAATAGAGGAWAVRWRADRRAIRADPAHAVLSAPLHGRVRTVRSADGTPLHVEEFGPADAPTVVLVHGWTCALRFWTCQIQPLQADHHVVAYDLRGHGESGHPDPDDYSMEAHAADLDAVLRATVPAGQRPLVAGHSLGAMTLMAWAHDRAGEVTDRIGAAALLNTGMGDLISESFVLRAPQPLAGARELAGRVLLAARAPLPKSSTPISHRVVRYVALSPAASPAQVAFCERIVLDCRSDVRAANGGTLSELDLREAIASLAVPTVVIAGEDDKLTPPVHARRLAAELPALDELVLVPGAGHMGPVSDPEVVTGHLRRLAGEHATAGTLAA